MKNADYWRGRFAILENSAHKQADEYLQTLEDIYRETEHTVQRDIESWYQRFATNNNVTLAEARKMLTTGQLEEFKWTAEQYVKAAQQANLSPEWIKKLENASTRFHVSRLEAIQLQIQQQMELLFGNQVDGIDDLLKKLVSNGYTHGAFEIQKGIGLGWDFTALNQKKLETLLSKPWTTDGRTFRDRCWVNKADLVDTVNKELIRECCGVIHRPRLLPPFKRSSEQPVIRQGGWCIQKPPISTLFPKSRCIKIWVWIRLKLWKRWIPAPVRYANPLMER